MKSEFYIKYKVYEKYFGRIRRNEKNIEIRLYRGGYKNIKIGDRIKFVKVATDEKDKIYVRVTDVNIYPSYQEMCEDFAESNCYPLNLIGVSKKELEEIYSIEKQIEFNLMAIKFEKIKY